jgi:ABC-type branched-subunit amino acid transport system substrate-binding protein
MPIASQVEYGDSVNDFREIIAAARASRPDVYYVEGMAPRLDTIGRQLRDAGIASIASVVAPSLATNPEVFEGAWYTDSDLRDIAFRQRFESRYPDVRFATHMMPYAYDSFNLIVQAYERGLNPAAYLRTITSYAGTAGPLTKAPGSGNFHSTPAVWVIQDGKPTLLHQ